MSAMREGDVIRILWVHYARHGYALSAQVPAPPAAHGGRDVARVIDLVAVHPYPDLHHAASIAIEVKVTRQDFAADVRNPAKQAPWIDAVGHHYYAAPHGLIRPEEVPGNSGLLEVGFTQPGGHPSMRVHVAKAARGDRTRPAPHWLTHELLVRGTAATSRLAGWAEDPTPEEDLHRALQEALDRAEAARRDADRALDTAAAWRALAAAQGRKVPCADCGAAVVPTRVSAGALTQWRHAQPHLTGDCPGNTAGVHPRDLYDDPPEADQ